MKCYTTIDPKTKKRIFIPMCSGGEYHGKSGCHCPDQLTVYQFEKVRFNEMIAKKNETISMLTLELNEMRKILKLPTIK